MQVEIEVDYKTVGQYTGLKDKNSKDIFEDDIVQTTANGKKWIVCFSDFSWFFDNKNIVNIGMNKFAGNEKYSFCEYLKLLRKANAGIQIIGNIYESPELLEA